MENQGRVWGVYCLATTYLHFFLENMAEKDEKPVVAEETESPSKETTKESVEETGASEEPQAYFEPVVKLDEVEVVSGEEDETVEFKMRAKLYDYKETLLDKGTDNKSWCERGIGEVRFLKHKEFGKTRMLMRQEKTHKIIINHLVDPRTVISPNMGSDRAWVWSCYDFSEGETETKVFALRFKTSEFSQEFKAAFEKAQKSNAREKSGKDAEDTTAGDEAAEALETLNVKQDE